MKYGRTIDILTRCCVVDMVGQSHPVTPTGPTGRASMTCDQTALLG